MNKLYCFSLYCEGNGLTKSQAFATIQETREKAYKAADTKNKSDFPLDEGWHNHQYSVLEIPIWRIVALAKEYEEASKVTG